MIRYFFLSRRDHDRLLDSNPRLLVRLFSTYERTWGIGGVTFHDVSKFDAGEVQLNLA
jgi:hypothetical protein